MRVCSASAARVLTLLSLALLSSHSFILANAQANSQGTDIDVPGAAAADDNGNGTAPSSPSLLSSVTPSSISTSASPVTTPPTTTPTSHSTTSQRPTSPTTTPSPSPSSNAPDTDAASNTSSSNPSTSATTSSDPTASQTSSSSVPNTSGTSSSIPSSSSSGSSSSTSALPATSASNQNKADTTLVVSPTGASGQSYAGPDTTTYNWLSSTASATGAAADGVSASSKSFFDNKGAVAGTFTVVGLVALGAVVVGVIYAKRRAARLQDEEDMTYFEKYNAPNMDSHDGPGDLSFGNDNPSEAQIMTHAAPDAYPDRSMHYGLPTMAEYTESQQMDFNNYGATAATGAAGVGYPPGTAYARAQAQQGQQYQYEGHQYEAQTGAYGADYSAQYQEAYYDPRRSPNSASHPYADPRNSPRADGAPPVQQPYGSNVELVQGEAR